MTKLCENPTTKWLRDQYKAFPVETPEERLKPMILLEQNKNTFLTSALFSKSCNQLMQLHKIQSLALSWFSVLGVPE